MILVHTILFYDILYCCMTYSMILVHTVLFYDILYYFMTYSMILVHNVLFYDIMYYCMTYSMILVHTVLFYDLLYYFMTYYTLLSRTVLFILPVPLVRLILLLSVGHWQNCCSFGHIHCVLNSTPVYEIFNLFTCLQFSYYIIVKFNLIVWLCYQWSLQDFLHLTELALGSTQPPIQWVLGLSWGVKQPGHDVDHLPPSNA